MVYNIFYNRLVEIGKRLLVGGKIKKQTSSNMYSARQITLLLHQMLVKADDFNAPDVHRQLLERDG
jgi:hypothetical protein